MNTIDKNKLKAVSLAISRTRGISREIGHVLQDAEKILEFIMVEVEGPELGSITNIDANLSTGKVRKKVSRD